MPATQTVHDLQNGGAHTPPSNGYDVGSALAAMHQELVARLVPPARRPSTPEAWPDIAERCVQGVSRASGPLLLFIAYGAIAGFLISYSL